MATDPDIEVVDIQAAAEEMHVGYRPMAHKIKRLIDAHSAHTDLSSAYDMAEAVVEAVKAAEHAPWAQHAVSALTYSAVILYVRATKSNSRHRSTLNLRDKFDHKQLAFHDALCRLRDDAIAHFGPGSLGDGKTWHEEKAILPLDKIEDARVVLASRRVSFAPEFVKNLRDHVQRSMILAQRELEERDIVVVDSLDELMDDDVFMELLRRHKKRSSEIFDGHPSANLLFEGDRTGIRTGLIWD